MATPTTTAGGYHRASLTGIGELAVGGIGSVDTSLATSMDSLGPNASAAQLVAFQIELAKNSVLTAAWSAIAKERSDVLKGVVQKF